MLEDPSPFGELERGDRNEGKEEEEEEELVEEEEEEPNVKIFDFNNYNKVLLSKISSQKATHLDDPGIRVHW